MGTNYYHRTNICNCCGRYDEYHIGKNSHGWEFSFQQIRLEDDSMLDSYQKWLTRLGQDGKIFDEYGREHTIQDFKEMVRFSKGKMNFADLYPSHAFKDSEGWSFTIGQFS